MTLAPRPTLTPKQKLTIMARFCRCPGLPERGLACGKQLPALSDCQFDHMHARVLGGSDELANYRPLCPDCHAFKTFGRRPGAERTATTAGSDVGNAAKVKRLARARMDRESYAASGDDEIDRLARITAGDDRGRYPTTEKRTRKPSRWPKRKLRGGGFQKRRPG